ncbi:MAG: electron transport complex subunit E [Clostridiales bacterium]|nr:electron transport complex subunit E [Clostridiales bacterium]
MAKNNKGFFSVLFNGLIPENPIFTLMLGMCPTLAITTAASNGIGMGLATTAVLVCSNVFISLLRKIIPEKVRIPAFIVIIASFVTMVEMLMKAYLPDLYNTLGMYISLIVVNCIIFARAEAFAFKNTPVLALADGIGMGLGFTGALTILASIRELLGAGTVFGFQVMPETYEPMAIMLQVPGGFVTLGLLLIAVNAIKNMVARKASAKEGQA